MHPKDHIKSLYRMALLPVLRGAATPVFRFAVKVAAAVGLLGRADRRAGSEQKHIVIVYLSNHVGDTVMLLPMIEALRAAHPRALLECVVQAPIGSFLRLVPSLDCVHEFHIDHGRTSTPWDELRRTVQILKGYWKSMRRTRPTTCIVPRWDSGFRDLMLAYLLQAPERVGFASDDFDQSQPRTGYRDALLTRPVQRTQNMTEPARFLYLVERAGLVPPSDLRSVDLHANASMLHIAGTVNWPALAERLTIDSASRLAVVAPGASVPRRMWPIDRWATVVDELHSNGFRVALLTGRQDAEVAQRLYDMLPDDRRDQTTLIAGTTTLPESACLIAHSQLFVGNDSGPGHIAGSLGIPCVILFIAAQGADPDGPSAPERIRPMGQHIVCCRPSQLVAPCTGYCTADCAHCILQIQPEDAQRAIRSLLAH